MADDRLPSNGEPEHPRGTLFLMMVLLLLIVVTWLYTYTLLITRGT